MPSQRTAAESATLAFEELVIGADTGPEVLILGGVHGDEYEPILAIRRLAHQLAQLELAGRVRLIPQANPPAFALGQRTGPDDLDMARTFPGNPQGTITEQLAARITPRIQQADYLIDLHTGGRAFTIYPLTGYMLCSDVTVLESQRRMARAFGLPLVWGTSPALEGRSLSVAREAGVPAIYAEWGGGGGCQPGGVAAYVQGCLNVLCELGLLTQAPRNMSGVESTGVDTSFFAVGSVDSANSIVVEDAREASGHLQVNYPAPRAGFYEPAFPVGTFVEQGTCLGRLWETLEDPGLEILARQTGLLILNRACPAVNQGDCLATIIDHPIPHRNDQ